MFTFSVNVLWIDFLICQVVIATSLSSLLIRLTDSNALFLVFSMEITMNTKYSSWLVCSGTMFCSGQVRVRQKSQSFLGYYHINYVPVNIQY